jgi:hypothetical protein
VQREKGPLTVSESTNFRYLCTPKTRWTGSIA